MLSSHCFLHLPLRLPPWTVPCRIVLASPGDHVMCPYHFRLPLFTEVRSSYGPLAFTSSLVMWLLYEIPRGLRKHLLQCMCPFNVCCYGPRFTCMQKKIWTWSENASVWSWSWWRCSCHSRRLLVWWLNSALAIQSSALAVLAVRQLNIYCSSAPPTSHSERESGQTTLP